MRTKLILTLLLISSIQIEAQENFKKCITTQLMEKESFSNSEYIEVKQHLIDYQKENRNYKNQSEITTSCDSYYT